MSLPKPLQAVVDLHREQPYAAAVVVAATGALTALAALAAHNAATPTHTQTPLSLANVIGLLLETSFALGLATLVCWVYVSRSRVLLVAIVWLGESMALLGLALHVTGGGLRMPAVFMAVCASVGYVITVYRLNEKYRDNCAARTAKQKMAPFAEQGLLSAPAEEDVSGAFPTRK
jgi:hypothetical protein